jgi:fructose/tagatose bisphosphate aldolase
VLHGCSSVPPDQVANLFSDGICKVNLWTALERDSSAKLLPEMARQAGLVAGGDCARRLQADGLLGPRAEVGGPAVLSHCTTAYRQQIVFESMRQTALNYLTQWYR